MDLYGVKNEKELYNLVKASRDTIALSHCRITVTYNKNGIFSFVIYKYYFHSTNSYVCKNSNERCSRLGNYYSSNKKVMTVNGSPVYWNEYAYFLCAILANMERYGMQVSDWSAVYDESSQSTYTDLEL